MVQEAPAPLRHPSKQKDKDMEKKNYLTPELEVMEMEAVSFFAASIGDDFSSEKGGEGDQGDLDW